MSNLDALTRDAWWELVKDMPRELVVESIKSYAAANRFAPSIAEIRAEAIKAVSPELASVPTKHGGWLCKPSGALGTAARGTGLILYPRPSPDAQSGLAGGISA